MRRRRRRNSRNVILSFGVVILVLSVSYVALLYLGSGVNVHSLPADIPEYSSSWGKLVPSDAIQFTLENFSYIHTLNSSLPPQTNFLTAFNPSFNITTSDIRYYLVVIDSIPNATVSFFSVSATKYSSVAQAFTLSNQTHESYDGIGVYQTLYLRGVSVYELGKIALIPNGDIIGVINGTSAAQEALYKSLDVLGGKSASAFDLLQVRQMLYIAGGVSGHLALGLQGFAGVVGAANMTLISVDQSGSALTASYTLAFANTNAAVSNYSKVKSAYLSATRLDVYDSYVKAVEPHPLSALEAVVRLAA